MVVVKRGDVYLVALDPARGHEIKKTRPALVVSPDEMNAGLATAIVAPMTTKAHAYPTRVPLTFGGKKGFIVLDQLRTVDRVRLVRRLGGVSAPTLDKVLAVLHEMFAR
jgi:mRNA interferase MazF